MLRSRIPFGPVIGAPLAAVLLAGCVTPHIQPQVRSLAAPQLGLTGSPIAPATAWWRDFDDPQLSAIMADALAANPTLDVAMARLRAARAAITEKRADLYPQVGVDAQETQELFSGAYIIPPPYGGSTHWIGTTQGSLNWTLDFAGRQRALISQARNNAEAVTLDLAAARLAITGAVAQAYVGLARAELQMAIAQAFVDSRTRSLALAHTRSDNNLASQFDIKTAETLLAQAQQSLDRARGDRLIMLHALAALAGRGPEAYRDLKPATLRFDAALPVPATLPANLIQRRPDLMAAQARIRAATSGRKAAAADFYPTVDLQAFVGVSAIGAASLFTGNALTGGGGPAVHVPIFEGGRLRARYREATAEVDAATADFNGQAVKAVQEAADSLSAIDTNAADAADQRRIVTGLADTVRLDETRVRTGLGSQLDILASGDRVLQARQAQADLDAQGLSLRIQLLVAVGGDFTPVPVTVAALSSDPSLRARP